jgi:hypothetical protein
MAAAQRQLQDTYAQTQALPARIRQLDPGAIWGVPTPAGAIKTPADTDTMS